MKKIFREVFFDGKHRLVSVEDLLKENGELLKKIDGLEKNLAGTEQTIHELLDERTELSIKVLQLERKLGIAVNTLEECVCLDDSNLMRTELLEALKQIKELEK